MPEVMPPAAYAASRLLLCWGTNKNSRSRVRQRIRHSGAARQRRTRNLATMCASSCKIPGSALGSPGRRRFLATPNFPRTAAGLRRGPASASGTPTSANVGMRNAALRSVGASRRNKTSDGSRSWLAEVVVHCDACAVAARHSSRSSTMAPQSLLPSANSSIPPVAN